MNPRLIGSRGRAPAPVRPHALRRFAIAGSLLAAAALSGTVFATGGTPEEPPPPDAAPVVEGLKGIPVPEPSNLGSFVRDKAAAIRLGKALFWDMQLGSDGKTACASCHFHAGADSRSRNQVSPGLLRRSSLTTLNPDTTFQVGGVNHQFVRDNFPFHKFADPNNRDSAVVRSFNDAATSQGVFCTNFVSATPGAGADQTSLAGDPVFQLNGSQTRRVEPRNTPTVINAIFNFRNFWDGRATYLFNGVSPFGAFDTSAKVYKTGLLPLFLTAETVRIDNASVASQAVGPVLSDFEMAGIGRSWPQVGVRLLTARPLAQQQVAATDSVLAGVRHASGVGLNGTYQSMVQAAFKPEWWNSTATVFTGGKTYSQQQANFSLYFGLAVQLYTATLVSDDSPFDRHMAGDTTALSTDARLGMALFLGKGKCANCHGGAEFTNASVRRIVREPISRMVMGDRGTAIYDEGFYNISIAKTLEDISVGDKGPSGRPFSLTRLAQQVGASEFERLVGIRPGVVPAASERIAINGAFKTPTIRNAELTAPYFHNGDSLTLEQVVEFYNRGGNHVANNRPDLDADIQPLGLTATERAQLVAFIKSTTDERVRFKRAPFDHPQLIVPNGHEVGANGLPVLEDGRAKDLTLQLPAVGREGLARPQPNFLEVQAVQLVAQHSGKCLEVVGSSTSDAGNVEQRSCNGANHQLWEEVKVTGGFMLRNKHSGKCMDVSGVSYATGANIYQWSCIEGANQVFNWVGAQLRVNHSGQCVNVYGASAADGANVVQWTCSTSDTNDRFAVR